jgi:hypothetical protein
MCTSNRLVPKAFGMVTFFVKKKSNERTKDRDDHALRKASQEASRNKEQCKLSMFLTSKMLRSEQQDLLFSFPLMEKKQKIKLIRCRAFPMTNVFLQRISETTLLFERPQDEVFVACHATTPVALCSISHSLKQIEPDYRIEQGAEPVFRFAPLTKMLHEIMDYADSACF